MHIPPGIQTQAHWCGAKSGLHELGGPGFGLGGSELAGFSRESGIEQANQESEGQRQAKEKGEDVSGFHREQLLEIKRKRNCVLFHFIKSAAKKRQKFDAFLTFIAYDGANDFDEWKMFSE
jgi:hypothetical protein